MFKCYLAHTSEICCSGLRDVNKNTFLFKRKINYKNILSNPKKKKSL